jgi:DNA processing protein
MSDVRNDREMVLSNVETAPRPEVDALLMAARFFPFSALERIRILLRAPGVDDLNRLDHYEVERCIGRPLRRTAWQPRRLQHAIAIDKRWHAMSGRHVLWIGDREYPRRLRDHVYDPPAVLFGWGNPEALEREGIAVIGTRTPDQAGRVAAYRLGLDLGAHAVAVVSGLARGIDACAHRGAVASETAAVAVLGSGVDTIYPGENRALAADILDGEGLILSEYPPGTPPHRRRFPARNRIVVGLSRGVVVVQAPEPSGALISAEFGLQAGLEVMIHRVGEEWSGCRALIQAGAPTISTAKDVFARVHGDLSLDPRSSSLFNLETREIDPASFESVAQVDHGLRDEERKMALFSVDPDLFEVHRPASNRSDREVSP